MSLAGRRASESSHLIKVMALSPERHSASRHANPYFYLVPAMHHRRCVVELVENIARNVDVGQLNMALVCKAFYEPAMDALWRKMDGLEPLLRCLPHHVLEEDSQLVSLILALR